MTFSSPQFDRYRLVLVSPTSRRVFVERVRQGFVLPRLSIPRWMRVAEKLTEAIKERWGFKSIILDYLGHRPGTATIVVAQRINESEMADCSEGYLWQSLNDVSDQEVHDQERSIVQRLLTDGRTGRGQFSRLNWTDEALEWIRAAANIDESQLTGEIHQLNASADSTLIRVGRKNAPYLWLKASGGPNAQEGSITRALTGLFPEYLPEFVAFHPEWNAWLMKDAGCPLGDQVELRPPQVEDVILRLAGLQMASVHHVGTLLSHGCHDHRMTVLRTTMPQLVPHLEEAMAARSIDMGYHVEAARLREVAKLIEEASFRLEELGIPDALIHSDIDLSNILSGPRGCIFTDWAQAGVGNPIVTFEQLRVQFSHEQKHASWTPRITEIYQNAWRPVLPDCNFGCAFTLAPLISIASYICNRRDWITSEHRRRSDSQSYARALARQLDRAAQAMELNQSTCA
jgi:hypothetical protein